MPFVIAALAALAMVYAFDALRTKSTLHGIGASVFAGVAILLVLIHFW